MTVTLTPKQQAWLEAEVAAGHFASVEEAVQIAVAELMRPVDTRDLSWAKPYIDEARASLARGEGIPADQVFGEVDARLKQRGA
jgi:Arc/MetJ-type ribon-helix-helix transcriptional regulator